MKLCGICICIYIPPQVDRIWLLGFFHKITIYPILYILKGDHIPESLRSCIGKPLGPKNISHPYMDPFGIICIIFTSGPKPIPYDYFGTQAGIYHTATWTL